jgi:hypothetical protein
VLSSKATQTGAHSIRYIVHLIALTLRWVGVCVTCMRGGGGLCARPGVRRTHLAYIIKYIVHVHEAIRRLRLCVRGCGRSSSASSDAKQMSDVCRHALCCADSTVPSPSPPSLAPRAGRAGAGGAPVIGGRRWRGRGGPRPRRPAPGARPGPCLLRASPSALAVGDEGNGGVRSPSPGSPAQLFVVLLGLRGKLYVYVVCV